VKKARLTTSAPEPGGHPVRRADLRAGPRAGGRSACRDQEDRKRGGQDHQMDSKPFPEAWNPGRGGAYSGYLRIYAGHQSGDDCGGNRCGQIRDRVDGDECQGVFSNGCDRIKHFDLRRLGEAVRQYCQAFGKILATFPSNSSKIRYCTM